MVEAVYQGQVIARSEDTVVIEDNHHFPPGDVDVQYLRRSRMKSLSLWKAFWDDVTLRDTDADAG